VSSKYGIKHAHREAIMHRQYEDIEKKTGGINTGIT